MIRHEEGIELGRLEPLCEMLQMGEIEVGIGVGAGVAPRPCMNADWAHEGPETQAT